MAVAVSQATEARAVTRPERKLAWLLRLYALLCSGGASRFSSVPTTSCATSTAWAGSCGSRR
jgi:hypothetical protein